MARLDGAVSGSVLREALQSPQWSVRVGALRALAQQPGLLPMTEIQGFLTDRIWPVREAALHALLAYGSEGLSKLCEYFLETDDASLREQIIAELSRSGLIVSLLQNYGESPGNLETRVVERLISMGATRCLHAALRNNSGRHLLRTLFQNIEEHSAPKIEAWLGLYAALEASRQTDRKAGSQSKMAA
jgi:hypothetical protein